MKEFTLKNNIKSIYKQNKNTPRMAFTLNIAITEPEKYAGTYSLMNRLLLQGTEKYSNTELAKVLDENAIELYTDMKQDYLRFRFVCLNEDFELAIKILDDIINNTTFIEFDKENRQMIGLPPYGKMAVIILSGASEEKVYKTAKDVLKIIPIDDNVEVLGPAPVFLYKYNDNFRFKIIVKTKNNINLQKLLRYVLEKINLGNVRIKIDVNPNNIP